MGKEMNSKDEKSSEEKNIKTKRGESEIQKRAHKKVRKKAFKQRFKIGETEKQIITMIGAGILILGSFALPNLPIALKPFFEERGTSGFNELMERLVHKKIINLGGEKIELTQKGEEIYRDIQVKEIKIERPKKWDGVWHLVSYDIPKKFNKERDLFRNTLKDWDFYQIQASLWVLPFECREEVAVLAEYLGVAEYIVLMNTDYLPNEEEVEEFFNL